MTGYTFKPQGYRRDHWMAVLIDERTKFLRQRHKPGSYPGKKWCRCGPKPKWMRSKNRIRSKRYK